MNQVLTPKPQSLFSNKQNVLAAGLLLFPVLFFGVLLFQYSVNVPWMDDIDAFLNFISGYLESNSITDRIDWLLRPNNEHRILTAKVVTLILYYTTGEVNFRSLIFIAFFFLLGLIYLLFRVFRSIHVPLIAFAPVPFLILQPQHYLTSIWAITALQHQVVVFFTFTAIYLLSSQKRNRFGGSLFLQILASLSMSNGLFGWIAGAVVLALQRHWLRLGLWLTIGTLTIIFYFHDFQTPQGNETSFSFFVKYPYLIVAAFFTFLGALFDFFPTLPIFWRSVLPTLAGLMLIPTLLWLVWRMYGTTLTTFFSSKSVKINATPRNYFFAGCYTFLIVNALIVAFLRPRFGYSVMLVSNYMLYPAILVSLLYLNILSEFSHKSLSFFFNIVLLISILIWTLSYLIRLPRIAYRKQFLLTCAYNQHHNQIGLGPTRGTPFDQFVVQVMAETQKRKLYYFPDSAASPYESQLQTAPAYPTNPTLAITIPSETENSLIIETKSDFNSSSVICPTILVETNQQLYLFPSETPYTFTSFWLKRPVSTVKAEVFKGMLPAGNAHIGLLASSTASFSILFSKETIKIDH